jgi:hypothetical protein
MHGPDAQKLRLALESVRADLVAAVHAWRAQGRDDAELALLVDGRTGGAADGAHKPTVTATTRKELELSIPDFDPTIAIEFAKDVPGQAPAVVDLRDVVRRVVWIDLTPPLTW